MRLDGRILWLTEDANTSGQRNADCDGDVVRVRQMKHGVSPVHNRRANDHPRGDELYRSYRRLRRWRTNAASVSRLT